MLAAKTYSDHHRACTDWTSNHNLSLLFPLYIFVFLAPITYIILYHHYIQHDLLKPPRIKILEKVRLLCRNIYHLLYTKKDTTANAKPAIDTSISKICKIRDLIIVILPPNLFILNPYKINGLSIITN